MVGMTSSRASSANKIHSRMPAILESQSEIEAWLSARSFDDKVRALVKPFAGKLEFYPVDKGVGAVRNDSRDFIKVRLSSKDCEAAVSERLDRANSYVT